MSRFVDSLFRMYRDSRCCGSDEGGHVVFGGNGAAKQVESAYVSLEVGSDSIYCRVDWEGSRLS